MSAGPVFDKFTLPQFQIGEGSSTQKITDDSWQPSTINESTRTLGPVGPLGSMNVGSGILTISQGQSISASFGYTYNANLGNTADFRNLEIIISFGTGFNALASAVMVLTDINGSTQIRDFDSSFLQSISWTTSKFTQVNLSQISLMRISIASGFTPYIINSLRSIIIPSGGSGGISSNTCGY